MEFFREAAHSGIEDRSEDSEYLDYDDFCEICNKSILLDNRPIFNSYWCRGGHTYSNSIALCLLHYESI